MTTPCWAGCGDKHIGTTFIVTRHYIEHQEENCIRTRNAERFLSFQLLGMHGGAKWVRKQGSWWLQWCLGKEDLITRATKEQMLFFLHASWAMLCAFPQCVGAKTSPKRENKGTGEEQSRMLWQRANVPGCEQERTCSGGWCTPPRCPILVPRPWHSSPHWPVPVQCLSPCAAQLIPSSSPTPWAPAYEDQQDLATEIDLG